MPTNEDDDRLLRRLGALAKDQEREPTAEELAELEGVASLDADAQDRIAANLEKQMGGKGGMVVRPARWRAQVGVLASGLALAAGVALFMSRSGTDAVPLYALDTSGAASVRGPSTPSSGATATTCVLRASSLGSFEVIARPHDPVDGAIGAHAFLLRGGVVESFTTPLEISPQGSVRASGENQRLVGASELRVVVGRPSELGPDDALSKARGTATSGRGWQMLRCTIEAADR